MHFQDQYSQWSQCHIILHDYGHHAQQCIPYAYAMALQCPHARNLRDDYIDLKTNNQFDVDFFDVSYICGNILQFMRDIIYIGLDMFSSNKLCQ